MLQPELDRLDLLHHCLLLRTDGKLHYAPIDPNLQRVLDLATGTGIWAIDMGNYITSFLTSFDIILLTT
jgi:hypothetical protein